MSETLPQCLKRMLFSLIKITLAVFVGCGILVVLLQNRVIYHPTAYAEGEVDGHVAEAGVVRLPYATEGGRQEAYWIIRGGADVQVPLPDRVWLVFSGNAAQALDWVDFLDLYRGPQAGFLLIDYPGYGVCEGKPSPAAILESATGAVAALGRHLECDETRDLRPRLAVLGQSLGAAAGLQAAVHFGIKRVVLISPFTTLVELARRTVGPVYSRLIRHRWDNAASLAGLLRDGSDVRVSILHGAEDQLIPPSMSQRLAEQYPGRIALELLPGLGHNDINYGASERIVASLAR